MLNIFPTAHNSTVFEWKKKDSLEYSENIVRYYNEFIHNKELSVLKTKCNMLSDTTGYNEKFTHKISFFEK